ncbi:MFS transporte [Candidatus Bealeia paramacronuclearis]|uniref:Lysosomal dipeptide transporter MFSD1 n=1 Tax=Candidatus Bealeia paramacronuclearis TaxID=1921001 RepID=A0ABZ2C5A7_9PROT|nr:MFS transporte [Candidatus Bealeia paramacronuclearis]
MTTKMNMTMKWTLWCIASLFYAYQYILRVMPNIMIGDIMTQYQIDSAVFGQFSGVYYIGYSLMHLPLGLLLDRYGPKNILPLFMGFTVLGTLPLVLSDFWLYPIVGRFLVGMGSSAAILGVFKIIRMTFPENRFTRMLSFSVMIGLIGALYGGRPVNDLKMLYGFHDVIWGVLIIGIALIGITYFMFPPHTHAEKEETAFEEIRTVMTTKKALLVCFLAGLMVGPLEGFADVWGAQFLKKVYQFDDKTASGLPSLIFVGMCFGAPVLSYFAEKTNDYGVIILSAVVMAISFLLLLSGIMNQTTLSIMFVVVGVLCAYQIIAIYKASTYVPEKNIGLMTATANMIIMIFGYVFHGIIGQIIRYVEGGGADISTYSASSFLWGISVIPLALVISSLGFMMLLISEKKSEILGSKVRA